jgi:hypothetical protein
MFTEIFRKKEDENKVKGVSVYAKKAYVRVEL